MNTTTPAPNSTASTLENLTKAIQTAELLQQDLNACLKTASPALYRIVQLHLKNAKEIETKLQTLLKTAICAVHANRNNNWMYW